MIKTITVDKWTVKLQILDTAGAEKFRTLSPAYYRRADGVIIVYDVTDRGSVERIKKWDDECRRYAPRLINKILIGNKTDLEPQRNVSMDEADTLSTNLGMEDHIETSAKTGENVEKAIQTIASGVVHKLQRVQTPWFG